MIQNLLAALADLYIPNHTKEGQQNAVDPIVYKSAASFDRPSRHVEARTRAATGQLMSVRLATSFDDQIINARLSIFETFSTS